MAAGSYRRYATLVLASRVGVCRSSDHSPCVLDGVPPVRAWRRVDRAGAPLAGESWHFIHGPYGYYIADGVSGIVEVRDAGPVVRVR